MIIEKLNLKNAKSKFKQNYLKHNHFYGGYLVVNKNLEKIITVKFFDTGRVNYCALFITSPKNNFFITVSGKAGGCGYDRESASFQNALDNANILVEPSIAGVGYTAIEEVLEKIMLKLGYKKFKIFKLMV